jgi:threonylcarbamoyladenosine tRNA methylthiotransferase MtaB
LALAQALERVERMTRQGHHEVVLSGIHLGRYGAGLAGNVNLAGLLRALAPVFDRLGPSYRLRLSSIEPMEWTDELVDTVSDSPFVCRHFHVPLQSGDDSVLERMGRPYRALEFAGVVRTLRERFDDAALGTDILVGFPGEDQAAAENTLHLVDSLPLSYLHVFTFSSRPNTPASHMPESVPAETIRRRAAAVRRVGQKHWRSFLKKGLGRRHQVLLEKTGEKTTLGRTREYRPFRLTNQGHKEGKLVEVLAKRLDGDVLEGVFSKP